MRVSSFLLNFKSQSSQIVARGRALPKLRVFSASHRLFQNLLPTRLTAMVDVLLIVAISVALVILLVSSLYLLVYYQHPDDHNEAYVPKIIVMLGFVLAGSTVLLLPLDVANNEGYAGK